MIKKKKKARKVDWIQVLLRLAAFALVCRSVWLVGVPIYSDWKFTQRAENAMIEYENMVSGFTDNRKTEIMEMAEKYNEEIRRNPNQFFPSKELSEMYWKSLNINATLQIGLISIPRIAVKLPIYQGVGEAALLNGAGHIEGSSFPIGGIGTHALISGHRGLPEAKLFTNLNKLKEGDTFSITVLEQEIWYEVKHIDTILPEDIGQLRVVEDRDLVTLITCTPYGINTHRLLVTGERIDDDVVEEVETADALDGTLFLTAGSLSAQFLVLMLLRRHRKKKYRR